MEKIKAYLYGTSTPGWHIGTNAVGLGTWKHIAMTYDGENIKLYINGTEDYTDGNTGNITAGGSPIYLTFGGDGNERRLEGNLDEVSIWNKGLSSNEVSEIYNNGYLGNLANHSAQTNLVSWWRMGDGGTWNGTNWSIPDQKGTNDGTSVNMEEADRSTEVPPAPPIPSGTTFMAR